MSRLRPEKIVLDPRWEENVLNSLRGHFPDRMLEDPDFREAVLAGAYVDALMRKLGIDQHTEDLFKKVLEFSVRPCLGDPNKKPPPGIETWEFALALVTPFVGANVVGES